VNGTASVNQWIDDYHSGAMFDSSQVVMQFGRIEQIVHVEFEERCSAISICSGEYCLSCSEL